MRCLRSLELAACSSMALSACFNPAGSDPAGGSSVGSASTTSGGSASDSVPTSDSSVTSETTAALDGTGIPVKLDLGLLDDTTSGGQVISCKASEDDMNNIGSCAQRSPPDAFEPDVQWSWDGPGTERESLVTPLVANLTDDNGDGAIDLCDTPDIVVVATAFPAEGHIYILDGESGSEHLMIATPVAWSINPAIADIDDDEKPEIIAAVGPGFGGPSSVIAFENDGSVKWQNATALTHNQGGAITVADLDNDGDVEISMDRLIIDHDGNTITTLGETQVADNFTTVAADLDDDDDLEIVIGGNAYHHDGSVYYQNPALERGFAQVANLDGDLEPEVLITSTGGVTILDHTGGTVAVNQTPGGGFSWFRPAVIHDFDGDNVSEVASSSANSYVMFESDFAVGWSASVVDGSGWAGGTAFDFDGNGVAEAMYADETNLWVFDGDGVPLLNVPRSARTLSEYPVVADVDNDGSAEIVVVSDAGFGGVQTAPTVQVIRDIDDRWIQARRIWNQHTYHVTNTLEDGRIPMFEKRWWRLLNTFRTNSQIEGGMICDPAG